MQLSKERNKNIRVKLAGNEDLSKKDIQYLFFVLNSLDKSMDKHGTK